MRDICSCAPSDKLYQSDMFLLPDVGVFIDAGEAHQKCGDVGGGQDDVVQFVLGEAEPAVHLVEEFPGEVGGEADLVIDAEVVDNLGEDALELAFAVVGFIDVVGGQCVFKSADDEVAFSLGKIFFGQKGFDFLQNNIAVAISALGGGFEVAFIEDFDFVGDAQGGDDGGGDEVDAVALGEAFFALVDVVIELDEAGSDFSFSLFSSFFYLFRGEA